MKIKLIATLLGLAIAGGANAAIDQSATGNGELFFQLWDTNGTADKADDRNYVRDLGTLSNGAVVGGKVTNWASTATTPVLVGDKLVPQTGGIFSLGADANLTSFLAGTSNAAGLRWNITATDSAGTDRFLTTSSGITAGQLPAYAVFRTFSLQTDTFLANTTAIGTNESIVLNGAGAGISVFGGNVGGKATFTTDGAVGDQLGFYLLSEKLASGSAATKADLNQYKDAAGTALTWQFKNDGSLTYAVAAVPEPESYALFLAGLGMIGAIARRRRLGK
jgi:hypothetical protein